MKCPACGGISKRLVESEKILFRKESFRIQKQFFKCQQCNEQFTTEELDSVNISQVYNQYREKYQIPFPEQLREIRIKYGITPTKMAEVLGFGTNVYRNYERGEVPNLSNGTLLNLILNPKEFKSIIANKKNIFISRKFEGLIIHLEKLIDKENKNDIFIKSLPGQTLIPDEFTGYRKPSLEKFGNVVLYYLERCNNLFKVKLNKLLYYADFLHYKQTGYSITGCNYHAIQMGPVPYRYDLAFDLLQENNFIDYKLADINDSLVEQPVPLKKFDNDLFSESERHTLELILEYFNDMSTEKIVEMSHKEKGWLEQNKNKGIISYQKYAFELSIE